MTKRKGIRPRSSKRDALEREWAPKRKAWLLEHRECFVCGGPSCDVHEICPGTGQRPKAYAEPATWLAACRACHDWLHDPNAWPLARQAALKLLYDWVNFDLAKVTAIMGRAPSALTLGDVAAHLELLA
jgi:hypothetical protein